MIMEVTNTDDIPYRTIVTADLHISNRLPHSKPIGDGVTDRLQDAISLVKRINAKAKKCGAESTFILGDTFDRSLVDAVTLTHTTRAIVGTKVPMYILPGNHDANNIRGGRFVVEAFGAIEHNLVRYLDKVVSPRSWLNFIPIPFTTVAEAEDRIREVKKKIDKKVTNVLLFHNSVLGCDHLEWTCDDGLDAKLLTTGFDYALGGHFHEHQIFGKKNNGMYVGAPMHHNFGDRGRRAGYWVIDFHKNGKMECEFVEGGAPKFHVTEVLKRDEEWNLGDYVRVEVEATHHDWTEVKPKVKAFCDSIEGINMSYKHKPIYHHKKRLSGASKKTESVTIDGAMEEYIGSPGVVTGALKKKRLKKIGREILQEARTEHGTI
jgi:DNA repair exonuclease SbcCD nuclease subunit